VVGNGFGHLGPGLGLTREYNSQKVVRNFAFWPVDEVGDQGCNRGGATEYVRDRGEERREDPGLELVLELGLTREQVIGNIAFGLGESGDQRCNCGGGSEPGEDQGEDPGLEFLGLGLGLTFGLIEEGDQRCTCGDTRERGREPGDEQGDDPGLEFLDVSGLEL